MSKTIRNEQTKGFLDKFQKCEKNESKSEQLKADELFSDWDLKAIEFSTCREFE